MKTNKLIFLYRLLCIYHISEGTEDVKKFLPTLTWLRCQSGKFVLVTSNISGRTFRTLVANSSPVMCD